MGFPTCRSKVDARCQAAGAQQGELRRQHRIRQSATPHPLAQTHGFSREIPRKFGSATERCLQPCGISSAAADVALPSDRIADTRRHWSPPQRVPTVGEGPRASRKPGPLKLPEATARRWPLRRHDGPTLPLMARAGRARNPRLDGRQWPERRLQTSPQ